MRLKQSWKKWVILRNWVLGHKTHISNLILIVEQKMRIKRNRQTDRCKRCSFFVTHVQKISFWLIRVLIFRYSCAKNVILTYQDAHLLWLTQAPTDFLGEVHSFCETHAKISHFSWIASKERSFFLQNGESFMTDTNGLCASSFNIDHHLKHRFIWVPDCYCPHTAALETRSR